MEWPQRRLDREGNEEPKEEEVLSSGINLERS